MFNKKKQHFTQSLKDLDRVVWESEFMRFKALYAREQLRQEHDLAVEAIARVTAALEGDTKNQEYKADKEAAEKRLESIKEGIKNIDEEQIPSIDAKIKGLNELKPLIQHFIQKYC